MSRAVNLLICLAILVAGIAVEAPADSKQPIASEDKPCCGGNEPRDNKVGDPGISVCLQYLVYEDEVQALWVADTYFDSSCVDIPIQDYVWTEPGESAPQTCTGDPGCMHPPMGNGNCPAIQAPLPKNKSFIEILKSQVHYPGLGTDKTWNPKDGLVDLGELRTTFVKVKNVQGEYFAVRLAAGIAEMEKIRFPAGAFPAKPKIADLKILIGFEAEMDQNDIDKLPEAIPTPWKRYPDCPTAFVLTVAHSDYYVTTTAANPVKTASKIATLNGAKPIPKRTSNR